MIKSNLFQCFAVWLITLGASNIPAVLLIKAEEYTFLAVIYSLLTTAWSILLLPMYTGMKLFYLELSDGNGADLNNLIHPYTNGSMLEIIKARLLSILYIFLGVICFVIPGIYLALKYAMIEYVIADDKEMKYDAAMKRSGEIMKNQKGRLIVLVLSFIPWFLLVGITLGIAFVYVGPYFEATMVNFYKDIKLKKEREAADFQ